MAYPESLVHEEIETVYELATELLVTAFLPWMESEIFEQSDAFDEII
jgi:hypothetical protein